MITDDVVVDIRLPGTALAIGSIPVYEFAPVARHWGSWTMTVEPLEIYGPEGEPTSEVSRYRRVDLHNDPTPRNHPSHRGA